MCWPRKSNPSAICVILVFSCESDNPRSRRKCSTRGLTSVSSNSFELPVITKSSANRTTFTFTRRLFAVLLGYNSRSVASKPLSVRFASTGEHTPPTMLQTLGLFFLRQLWCERTHPENHADSFLVNLDPLDQRPYQLAPCLPIRRLQPGLDPSHKCLQSPQYQLQFLLHTRALTKLLHLCLQLLHPFAHPHNPAFKFSLLDEPIRVTVNQARNRLPQPPNLAL